MRKCDSCGKLYQESKDVFCPHCGAVAVKQCNHTSAFDAQKYDRGELYKYNNAKPSNTVYTQGVEPHAQRKVVYTQPQKNFNDAQPGSGTYPKINIPNTTKTFKGSKGNGGLSKYIGVIIIGVIIAINMISGLVEGFDFSTDYDVVTEDYSYMGDVYPCVKNASVALVEDDGIFKRFELSIENMYFNIEETDYIDYVEGQLVNGDAFVETSICSFTNARVTEKSFNDELDNSYYVSADDISAVGRYQFTADFNYDEIIFFTEDVKFFLENGSCVYAALPFDSFSIAEDGTVTYYTSYASDETNWDTIFTECSNTLESDSLTRGFTLTKGD